MSGERMFRSIVVGTDGSETADQAVARAVALARSNGARLHIVAAYEPLVGARIAAGAGVSETEAWQVGPDLKVKAVLENAAGTAHAKGVEAETYACTGDPAEAVLDIAEREKADLVIVGNKGMKGARRYLLGSVPNKVSHHAPCSVLIVRTT